MAASAATTQGMARDVVTSSSFWGSCIIQILVGAMTCCYAEGRAAWWLARHFDNLYSFCRRHCEDIHSLLLRAFDFALVASASLCLLTLLMPTFSISTMLAQVSSSYQFQGRLQVWHRAKPLTRLKESESNELLICQSKGESASCGQRMKMKKTEASLHLSLRCLHAWAEVHLQKPGPAL